MCQMRRRSYILGSRTEPSDLQHRHTVTLYDQSVTLQPYSTCSCQVDVVPTQATASPNPSRRLCEPSFIPDGIGSCSHGKLRTSYI